jgi:6-phosphogluconolactonase
MSDGRGEPELIVRPDAAATTSAAADRIAAVLAAAVAGRGKAHWATTGGSTPGPLYGALISPPLRDRVDWSRVHVWWGDDRFVTRRDAESNVRDVDRVLRAPDVGVGIPPANVHPIPADEAIHAGLDPGWAARRYAEEVRALVPPGAGGWPAFDLVLLGVGPDGHVLSVFPGSEAFDADEIALPIPAPTHVSPHVERVTLNPAVLDGARSLIVVVIGSAKAGVMADVLGPVRDERRWPAQRARRAGATWFIDEAAAPGAPGHGDGRS